MGMLDRIDHVVVLMLENRSFDCMLGRLYPKSPGFDGLAGTEANLDANGTSIPVWNRPGNGGDVMTIPDPDPGELFPDMNTQLFGKPDAPAPGAVPSMSGFVRSYLAQAAKPPEAYLPEAVMHYFTPEQVPVLSRLARQFAVCDRWHASAPCQTWPNRFFVHAATAHGYENNSPSHFPYEMPTVFNRFDAVAGNAGWKVYFHDAPQALTLAKLWPHLDRFRLYGEFRDDAKAGDLPSYSFIEPRYFADVDLPSDQHPPHVVTLGERLVADVYNCLRSNEPAWERTLLVVTYDEHGGCYDHVPPPPAAPPSATPTAPFNFDRFGVRVPAVIASPYIPQGTVLRPAGAVPFDHTSIIATLRKRFALGPPLSDRDAAAPDLDAVLTLPSPDNLGPETLTALPVETNPADLAVAQGLPLNNMQRALLELAHYLPGDSAGGDMAAFVQTHLAFLKSLTAKLPIQADENAATAVAFIKQRLATLFRNL